MEELEQLPEGIQLTEEDCQEEACGVFGVYSDDPACDASGLTYLGLYSLQHRGQESAGIVVSDGHRVAAHKEMGLVSRVFNPDVLARLKGRIAIGHVRYSTTGSSYLANAQPVMAKCSKGILAVAHNGNLLNAEDLRCELEDQGSVFQSSTDSEVIINLIARNSRDTLEDSIIKATAKLQGSYSLTVMTRDALIGIRDPHGNRPLCLGKIGENHILASESCAFSSIGAKFLRDVAPGEIVIINKNGLKSIKMPASVKKAVCVFEYIYFARPDSIIDGINVHMARKAMGKELAKEFQREADVVIPVPDSGISTAMGFADASCIPYDIGLIKNPYVGRTFIQPRQEMRDLGVRIKLNPVEEVIRDRRVIIIDDTIVRGTTSAKIIRLLRDAGAREVHMCVSAPPVDYPCFYGIDTSVRKELIAATHSLQEICEYIGADSLTFLSFEGMKRAVNSLASDLCMACFNGDYPIPIPEGKKDKIRLEEE